VSYRRKTCHGAVSDRLLTFEKPPPEVMTPPNIPVQTVSPVPTEREGVRSEREERERERESERRRGRGREGERCGEF
jgi:hypothetical protein